MSNWWEDRDRGRDGRRGMLAVGIMLIALGCLFLVTEQLNINWGNRWPLYVIVPGVVLLLTGLAIPHEAGLGMAIPGGIIATVGLVLAFQDYYDAYSSWAYVWPLVAPGSVGVTLLLYGVLHRRMDLLDAGLRTAATGLGLFVGFGLFFEYVIGIDSGNQPDILHKGLPFLAVVFGILIVVANLLPHPREASSGPAPSDTWSAGDTGTSNEPQAR